ncbi:MAG: DeoR/GlpR transcriptional regulator, partial [Leifsonia sp.]
NLPEADLKRVMVGAATRAVVVADGSKLGRTHLGRIAALDEVDELITGASAPAIAVAALRTAGLEVLVAE